MARAASIAGCADSCLGSVMANAVLQLSSLWPMMLAGLCCHIFPFILHQDLPLGAVLLTQAHEVKSL